MEINEIQSIIHSDLVRQGSPLSNFNTGSVLYTLTRAIAAGLYEVNSFSQNNSKNYNLLLAEGDALDSIANNYSISRNAGSFAKGNLLATNLLSDTSIPAGTILIEPIRQLEYTVSTTTTISSSLETRVPVQAISVGESYNLNAGNSLISTAFPNTIFYVGDYRTSSGSLCGGILGGKNSESDDEFRQRIITFLFSPQIGTSDAVLSVLNSNPLINDYLINIIFPGVIDVWLFPTPNVTISDSNLNDITNSLYSVVPVGTFVNPQVAFYTTIDVSLTSSQTLDSQFILSIKESLNSYFKTLVNASNPTSDSIQNFLFSQYNILFDVSLSPLNYNAVGLYYKVNNLNVSYSI